MDVRELNSNVCLETTWGFVVDYKINMSHQCNNRVVLKAHAIREANRNVRSTAKAVIASSFYVLEVPGDVLGFGLYLVQSETEAVYVRNDG